jgi:hypothetical protein
MGLIVSLIIFVGLAAIIVWIADYTSVGARRYKALAILNGALPAARSIGPNTKRNVN